MTTNDASDLFTIDPLHDAILKMYRAQVQGDYRTEWGTPAWDLQFESIHHAASWAQTCKIEDRVCLQDNAGGKSFSSTISVTYFPKAG